MLCCGDSGFCYIPPRLLILLLWQAINLQILSHLQWAVVHILIQLVGLLLGLLSLTYTHVVHAPAGKVDGVCTQKAVLLLFQIPLTFLMVVVALGSVCWLFRPERQWVFLGGGVYLLCAGH